MKWELRVDATPRASDLTLLELVVQKKKKKKRKEKSVDRRPQRCRPGSRITSDSFKRRVNNNTRPSAKYQFQVFRPFDTRSVTLQEQHLLS